MDKMREEFEAWAALEGLPVTYLESCGFYDAKATELCWQAWNASYTDKAIVMDASSVVEALEDAGVSYK